MQPFNKNLLVKTIYAYVDLFKKIFPLVGIFLIIPIFNSFVQMKIQPWKSYDFFNLFSGFLYTNIYPPVFQVVLIIAFNFFVGIGIYLALRKLTVFMENVFNDNPFGKENGQVLKYIGVMVVVLTLTIHIVRAVSIAFTPMGYITGITKVLFALTGVLSVLFNPYLILGMFVFLLGEIMLYAAEMKQESDLTV